MISKKSKFLLGILFIFLSSAASAQVGGKGSVYDSSVIPSKRMPQQNEFWAGTYNFPAKPRNMWEVGVSGGMLAVAGDVAMRPNWGFAVHVRKALGYIFSVRLQYMNGVATGLNWKASENFGKNPAWNTNLPAGKRYFSPERQPNGTIIYTDRNGNVSANPDFVYYNYKSKVQDLSLQGIINVNNILFHKQATKVSLYLGAGLGATAYTTMVNALDDAGNPYRTLFNSTFTATGSATYDNRKDILKRLRDGMDKSYETAADNELSEGPKMGKNTLRGSGTVLAGIAFKLSSRINLALEDRITFTKSDLIDGQQWGESPYGDAAISSQTETINYLSLGINVNLGKNSVEPLWWVNPLSYAYDELRNHRFVKIPKNECNDADGDGVCDHLDREPNTPAGCPVDTHGVTRDTDGDGVPDCKDKQLITPTECQPVNADGVGKCPDPECCKAAVVPVAACPCDYPSLSFKGTATALSAENKAMLSTVASKLKTNPTCTISVHGYPEASKASQANCQKRLDAIKIYLIEKEGISADRISVNCEVGGGEKNTVDVKCN